MKKYLRTFFIFTMLFFSVFIYRQSQANTLLVTDVLSNSVELLNETTLQLVTAIKVGYMPHEVIVTHDGKTAIVSNFGDLLNVIPGHSITTIDIANGKILKTIELPKKSRPHGLALLSDSEVLVTAKGIQALLLVDFINGQVIKTLALPGAGAHIVLIDAEKHFAYVSNMDSGSVCKINLGNFTVESEIKIGRQAEGLALSPQEDLLFVTDSKDNVVVVLRTKDLSPYKRISTAKEPVRISLFNNGNSLLVVNSVSGNVEVIDLATLSITNSYPSTLSYRPLPVPINAAVRGDQKTAYITNFLASNIILMDLTNGRILKSIQSNGYLPDGVVISPVTVQNRDETVAYETFNSGTLDVHANINDLWRIVKDVEDYNRISHGAVTAHLKDGLIPGHSITLELYKASWIGKLIPKSEEIISVVDDEHKILSWVRKLPGGSYTERYQILEKLSETDTRSSIIVRIPGLLGKITKRTLGSTINNALRDLNNGMKTEAELNASL